jgi:tRNA pseudouridine38/39 synthase
VQPKGLQVRPLKMDKKNDYLRWTKEALIQRVQALEAERAAASASAPRAQVTEQPQPADHAAVAASQQQPQSNSTDHDKDRELKPKKKKTDKKIDPSKYTTRLVAFKLAYIGKNYGGFEFQASSALSTIEEELWKALVKSCLIMPENPAEVKWDDWEYSKCGRTDRGVSAFGQVIGIRVRSNRPLPKQKETPVSSSGQETQVAAEQGMVKTAEEEEGPAEEVTEEEKPFDDFKDEIQYCKILNRLLPADIRILAWCPSVPADFSARHDCRERQYRYFFTQPAYSPIPNSLEHPKATAKAKDGWLDIDAMRKAAKKFEGAHDFRNFCKIDPSKLITNFERRIFECDIVEVKDAETALPYLSRSEFRPNNDSASSTEVAEGTRCPKVYYFHVRGSAFLWHQIRCMVAVIFMVGQGLEAPEVVDQLLDYHAQPRRPNYVLASEFPLVLWDCFFPRPGDPERKDALGWVYLGEDSPLNKHGAFGLVDDVWEFWRERKMDEILSGQLLNVVAGLADIDKRRDPRAPPHVALSQRTFEGGNRERLVGKYQAMLQKSKLPSPEETYEKEAKRRGYKSADHWREERNNNAAIRRSAAAAAQAEEEGGE